MGSSVAVHPRPVGGGGEPGTAGDGLPSGLDAGEGHVVVDDADGLGPIEAGWPRGGMRKLKSAWARHRGVCRSGSSLISPPGRSGHDGAMVPLGFLVRILPEPTVLHAASLGHFSFLSSRWCLIRGTGPREAWPRFPSRQSPRGIQAGRPPRWSPPAVPASATTGTRSARPLVRSGEGGPPELNTIIYGFGCG
jgi:hypothetical protein